MSILCKRITISTGVLKWELSFSFHTRQRWAMSWKDKKTVQQVLDLGFKVLSFIFWHFICHILIIISAIFENWEMCSRNDWIRGYWACWIGQGYQTELSSKECDCLEFTHWYSEIFKKKIGWLLKIFMF